MSGKCCLSFVFFCHFDLIITQEFIHKGEEHVSYGVIDQGIDMWQWKIVLRAGPIQISVINAHVYFPFFFVTGTMFTTQSK